MINNEFNFERIMIIDDNMIDRYTASFTIKKFGFGKQIQEFEMATKAIEYLEQNQDSIERLPQVILLDVNMPEMDGFEFLERLSQLPQFVSTGCCIIMLSSSLNPTDHERANNNPVVKKFLNKPLNRSGLEEIKTLYLEHYQIVS